MTDAEYELWVRRVRFAQRYAAEAYMMESHNPKIASDFAEKSKRFANAALDMATKHSQWVLALPTPGDRVETQPVFRTRTGSQTTDVSTAMIYSNYVGALAARADFPSGEYYHPEPLEYHLRRQTERIRLLAEEPPPIHIDL